MMRFRNGFLEPEDQRERFVYGSQLVGIEAPGGLSQALRIDNRGLLDQHSGLSLLQ